MNIRAANEADLEQISRLADEIALLHNTYEPAMFAEPDAARDRAFWLSCITQPDATVHIAEEGGLMQGFITAKVTRTAVPSFLKERAVCRIGTIVVSSRAQRRGVGTTLIRSIEAWARSESAAETRLEVFEFNRQALSFYASLGYAAHSHNLSKGLA